ncbi:MAG: hypothetical protein KA319_06660 [Ferruginibacter sp.]|nr:hypothetical protein [Ferruginibacter sp.]
MIKTKLRFFYAATVIISILLACSQNKKQTKKSKLENKKVDDIYQDSLKRINNNTFLIDYKDEIKLDTTFFILKDSKIFVKHYILTNNCFTLPKIYPVQTDSTMSNTYNIWQTETFIKIENHKKNEIFKINNSFITKKIKINDDQIAKYAVLLLNKNEVEIYNRCLYLHYSYSIPFTDLGFPVNVRINLVTNEMEVSN